MFAFGISLKQNFHGWVYLMLDKFHGNISDFQRILLSCKFAVSTVKEKIRVLYINKKTDVFSFLDLSDGPKS